MPQGANQRKITFAERYDKYAFPEPNTGCFIWMGSINQHGYGRLHVGYKSDGTRKSALAHRAAYEHFVGPIPEGLQLDHKCRLRCCVNPEHLEPVTNQENTKRGLGPKQLRDRQLSKTHCPQGHPYFGDNLLLDKKGRRCWICRRRTTKEGVARWKVKRKGQDK
jgi:hypothetical protein